MDHQTDHHDQYYEHLAEELALLEEQSQAAYYRYRAKREDYEQAHAAKAVYYQEMVEARDEWQQLFEITRRVEARLEALEDEV